MPEIIKTLEPERIKIIPSHPLDSYRSYWRGGVRAATCIEVQRTRKPKISEEPIPPEGFNLESEIQDLVSGRLKVDRGLMYRVDRLWNDVEIYS